MPDYCVENDPLLSYSTRLHSMEDHTCTKLPINFCVKQEEIKTEPAESNGNSKKVPEKIVESWKLDHDYCRLDVKSEVPMKKLCTAVILIF